MIAVRARVLLLLCAAAAARGAVLYVDGRIDPNADHDGASPETAFATLDDAAAAAGDGDEVRVLGGEGRTYEFAADTNGTLFAQARLRLVGWGGEPPVLRADSDVLRSKGDRLLRIAGEDSVVSNLCVRFTQYSAGPAAVLSVEAPRVSVRHCSFELEDGPAKSEGDLVLGGSAVTDQLPAAGTVLAEGTEVILYFDAEISPDLESLPELTGLNYEQARDTLSYYGLYLTTRSSVTDPTRQTVGAQSLPAGTELRHGSVVEVTLIDSDEELLGRY